jgi:DNA-binding LacI/PurR family transcriptional regulator
LAIVCLALSIALGSTTAGVQTEIESVRKNKNLITEEQSGPLMADVARRAGVAISTVSRALADPGRVNEKTRARITAAAEDLGYTPNAAARNLRVGKSDVVMIVLPGALHGASQIIPQVLQSINRTLGHYGYHLMIANLDRDEPSERHILDLAYGGSVCGAIIFSSEPPADGNRSLADTALPIVSLLLDLSGATIPSVVTNDRQAIKEATRHLIELGHSSFLYIAGPTGNYHDVERYAGVLEAIQQAGLSEQAIVRTGGVLGYQYGFQTGVEAADDFAALSVKPTAVIASSDDMAISFMSRVQRMGWSIPGTLSIVSFDGSPVSEYCNPPLSTIVQPVEDMGKAAVDLLMAYIDRSDNRTGERIVKPSRLILRESISVPRSDH